MNLSNRILFTHSSFPTQTRRLLFCRFCHPRVAVSLGSPIAEDFVSNGKSEKCRTCGRPRSHAAPCPQQGRAIGATRSSRFDKASSLSALLPLVPFLPDALCAALLQPLRPPTTDDSPTCSPLLPRVPKDARALSRRGVQGGCFIEANGGAAARGLHGLAVLTAAARPLRGARTALIKSRSPGASSLL